MSHLLISAAHKSSGKTTITLGLCASLTVRGMTVQPFKKGPDYIDPLWLTQAANRPCHNLDFYTMNRAEIQTSFAQRSQNADICIIEGNKGLYDGMAVDGSNSNAALAHLLGAPVILVLDTKDMTRGVAPLVLGYQLFDKNIHIAGVILNKVGGERHESKLRESMEYHTDVPVIGAVRRNSNFRIEERHLGLMPSNEDSTAQKKIHTIAKMIGEQVDLEQLLKIAKQANSFHVVSGMTQTIPKTSQTIKVSEIHSSFPKPQNPPKHQPIKIGVIRDAAFGFYYASDLEALEIAGAELIFINALHNSQLPKINALFIGGGFPETRIKQLANNHRLKTEIREAIENEMPVYAECGGLMYLARQLTWQEQTGDMVGALPFDIVMGSRPQGRGYVIMRETGQGLWPLIDESGQPAEFAAHEFHYSQAIHLPNNLTYAYQVLRGHGVDGQHDGIIYKNTLASYVHLRDVENNRWTQRFVEFIRQMGNG
jgi:cobyrinic acid a,c-diamide synthase